MRSILFIFALFAAQATMAEWKPTIRGSNLTAYIDPDSIKKSVDRATMRVLVDYKKPPFDGNNLPYLSKLLVVEYDCAGGRFRALETISFAGHMASGHRPYVSDEPGEWKTTTPTTLQHTLLDIACGFPNDQGMQKQAEKLPVKMQRRD